jgi:hypothetical protein
MRRRRNPFNDARLIGSDRGIFSGIARNMLQEKLDVYKKTIDNGGGSIEALSNALEAGKKKESER